MRNTLVTVRITGLYLITPDRTGGGGGRSRPCLRARWACNRDDGLWLFPLIVLAGAWVLLSFCPPAAVITIEERRKVLAMRSWDETLNLRPLTAAALAPAWADQLQPKQGHHFRLIRLAPTGAILMRNGKRWKSWLSFLERGRRQSCRLWHAQSGERPSSGKRWPL